MESLQTDCLLRVFPLPHGCDLALISLVGIICICAFVARFQSLQTETCRVRWSFKVVYHYEEMACCQVPEVSVPNRPPHSSSPRDGLARFISVKTSRTSLHPADSFQAARRTLYPSSPPFRNSRPTYRVVSSQDRCHGTSQRHCHSCDPDQPH